MIGGENCAMAFTRLQAGWGAQLPCIPLQHATVHAFRNSYSAPVKVSTYGCSAGATVSFRGAPVQSILHSLELLAARPRAAARDRPLRVNVHVVPCACAAGKAAASASSRAATSKRFMLYSNLA